MPMVDHANGFASEGMPSGVFQVVACMGRESALICA